MILLDGLCVSGIKTANHMSLFIDIYYIGKLVQGDKENSDWFSERSEFCNTDH